MVSTLTTKLWRNLWQLKGQSLAIALVLATGVAMYVMSFAMVDTLRLTQQTMYQQQHFADLFADLKRAPEQLAQRLEEIPGIATLETRVRAPVNLRLERFQEPVTGQVLSIPDGRQPLLNRLYLRKGQLPEPWRSDQVLVAEAFADAHQLTVGDELVVVIQGRLQRLTVTGIALSPEYIYQIRPGDLFPDFARYALLWMNRSAVEAAFGMNGAFNSLTATLTPGYPAESVIAELDEVLAPWGSLGAHDRDDLVSHLYLEEELTQLETMARFLPVVFLGVAAFLLNMVAARLIRTQREQIAVLKAFGYNNLTVAGHYLSLILVIVFAGALLGVLAGLWLTDALAGIYQDFFRFPFLIFEVRPTVPITAILIAGGAAVIGTLAAVRSAFRLPPAEAMRPEPPPVYRRTLLERLGIQWFSQPVRMILRNLERQPVKALLSVTGLAFAVAMMMLTGFQRAAIDHMMAVQFQLASTQDMTVTFIDQTPERAIRELASLPDVLYAEGFRMVPATLRHGHREYRTALQGYEPDSRLHAVLDTRLRPQPLPERGVMLTDHLAALLAVAPGDLLEVEVLEGRRQRLQIPVAGLVTEFVGVGAYLQRPELSRLLQEGATVSGALLAVEPGQLGPLFTVLESRPGIAGVTLRENSIQAFYELMDENILVFTLFSMFMAGSIAFAVAYNNARIAFAERGRELASLRVLGFTRPEVAFILLGELMLLTLIALLPGFALGTFLCWLLTLAMQTELYRIPLTLNSATYATAAAVVLVATLISALFIARNLVRLDMVAALKAPE